MNRLAVVKGYSQLLERVASGGDDRELDPARIVAYSTMIAQEATSFEHLLRQYFAAARLQWDDAAVDWHAVDLGRLAEQVATGFEASVPPRGARDLRVETLDDVQGIWDQRWLSDALAALIANALTYSPDGSVVQLTVRRQNDHAMIVITDTGSGIAPDEEEQIFAPFVRGLAAREHGAPGWGLGLFIASRAVMAHGGWLEIESEPANGSQFSIHMPLMPPAATALPA